MKPAIEFLLNTATATQIANHLRYCDKDFLPPLRDRVEITGYAQKIVSKATRFEAWANGTLIGLVAVYCNDQKNGIAHITNVSVLKAWVGQGIATRLMTQCIEHVITVGMVRVCLEVASENLPAIKLYKKHGFVDDKASDAVAVMSLYLKR